MQNIQPIIAKLINIIAKTPAVKKIILFGSRARGDADEKSDQEGVILYERH